MKILDNLFPPRELARYTPPAWMNAYMNGDMSGPLGYSLSYGNERAEMVGPSFESYVVHGLAGNGIVWSIERVRLAVFTETRFLYQRFRKGRPGDLYGSPNLALLERPWAGGSTGDLLARMILDVDMAGNFFGVELDGEIIRLRPDWVEIALTERWVEQNGEIVQVGWRRLGYLYYEGGRTGARPAVFLPEEVIHFAPNPDPLASWRGMSWLTPVVREIMADSQATKHKLKFFENSATPNLAVSLPKEVPPEEFLDFVDMMDAAHKGVDNAYKTLYTVGGADVTVVGADMRQIDFKVTQGAGESRLASAGGVHPAIVGLSEGLQGSSLNAGNFGAARRLVADATMRPLWRNAAGSLEIVVGHDPDSRLWYDTRDVAFLREDATDQANITQIQMSTIANSVKEGFEPASAIAATINNDPDLLVHTGNLSVQLQPPGGPQDIPTAEKTARSVGELLQKLYLGVGVVITAEEARDLLNDAGAGLTGDLPLPEPAPAPPAISAPKIPELTAPSQNGNGGG
jgi:hypothetical protein